MLFDTLAAEQGLLGILLTDNTQYDAFADILRPHHFSHPTHATLFAEIVADIEAGKRVSPVSMKGRIESVTEEVLVSYLDAYLFITSGREYAELIVAGYKSRQLDLILKSAGADNQRGKPDEVVSAIERALLALEAPQNTAEVSAYDAAAEAFKWMEDVLTGKVAPIRTGIERIDKIIGGLFPGRFYVLAGRPGMGKTALSLNIADNISGAGTPCLFLSLEMVRSELAMRLLAARTGLSLFKQQSPHLLTKEQMQQLVIAGSELKSRNLMICDIAKPDLMQVRTWARRFRRKFGPFVLFIDHLGLMAMDPNIRNKVHQIEEITTSLKALAKELQIPIVMLSQLSRSVESREDKRPMLSDLRDSGSIEQDADCVLLTFREEYYLSKNGPVRTEKMSQDAWNRACEFHDERVAATRGTAEVIIAKNRQGQSGTANLKFNGTSQQFTD